MKRFCTLASLILLLGMPLLHAEGSDGNYPRLSCFYLSNFAQEQNSILVPQLARYDLVVLDMEMGECNPGALIGIRQLNPNIKLLAYMSCEEITSNEPSQQSYPLRYLLKNGIEDSWWLWQADNSHASFWEETWMLNCSIYCPEVNGQTWNSYFAGFITDNVLSNPLWDGFFADNCWSNVPWEAANIDCDDNGVVDDRDWLDGKWEAGMNQMLNQLRQSNPTRLIIGNAGYNYGQQLNGAMIEEWYDSNPDDGFGFSSSDFLWLQAKIAASHQAPVHNMIAARQPDNIESDYRHMRYTLSATLMSSAFYGLDKGPEEHANTWWYDEYDCNLGLPVEDIVLTGSEQIQNGQFTNLNNWTTEVHSPLIWDDNLVLGSEAGNTFAQCNINNTDGLDWHYALKQANNSALSFTYGERYLVTFRAKADHARPIELVVMEEYSDYSWLMSAKVISLSTTWQTYEVKIISNNTGNLAANLLRFTFFMGQENGTVCIDDVSMKHIDTNRVLQREFQNGKVLYNPTNSSATINLGATYYHLSGTQDSSVNNGQACTSVTIPAKDGIILLKSPPTAIFTATPTQGTGTLSAQFTDASVAGNGVLTAWYWNFGDGSTSVLQHPLHNYSGAGVYTVSLKVTNTYGYSHTFTRSNYITVQPGISQLTLLSAQQYNFGEVYLSQQADVQTLRLQNTGTAVLQISSICFLQTNSPFTATHASLPITLGIGEIASFQLGFGPQIAGSESDSLIIINSSANMPRLAVRLTGTGEYAPLKPPEGVQMVMNGADAVISWQAVTQTILNTPIVPDYYLVFYNGSSDPEGQFYFHDACIGLQYTHALVGNHAANMFYRVHAYKAYGRRNSSISELRLKPGMSEEEVNDILDGD